MKKKLKQLLALVLTLAVVMGFALPAAAADPGPRVTIEKVSNDAVTAEPEMHTAETKEDTPQYADTDMVRVSITLAGASTVDAGYATRSIANNAAADIYRTGLKVQQQAMAQRISQDVLGGEALDVVWNMTLLTNTISANVPYGKIEAIEALDGVASVTLENRYEPDVVSTGDADPDMATSGAMIGSTAAWADGYTGAGSRIAVIDTGTDTDHISFDGKAFEYSLEQLAADAGKSKDEFVASLDLLDVDEIAAVLPKLNISKLVPDASKLYLTSKLPFAFNYVDEDFDITHDNDKQGEHGSHVAGIATANRYVSDGKGGYEKALDSVFVQGVAPDAQLITMKVFGKGGGAYDSDYMVAIEDAVMLGCDAVNLSLGSGNAGFTTPDAKYQSILDKLAETDTVVSISAGNSSSWPENSVNGTGALYLDDVNFATGGSPGSYKNSFGVASVDNSGTTGYSFSYGDGAKVFYTDTADSGYTNKAFATLDTSADGSGTEYEYVYFENTGADADGNSLLTDYADVVSGKIAFVFRGTSSFYQKHMAVAAAGAAGAVVCNNQAGVIRMDLSDSTATIPCVSILQTEAADIKAASTPVYAEDGTTVLYYTGKLTVSGKMSTSTGSSGSYTMSDFSSWGVPSDLSMKPEITAPGGNIYSVNGAVAGGQAYEVMSGTSMAAPQVAGMAALVAQYIRENGLKEKTGVSVRHLAQSLLMSTAEPVYDASTKSWYSILRQGAGLANVSNAIHAESYVLVNGQPDGKVKVELGDDPDRTGVYSADFTLNNLTDEAIEYTLSADVFTQAPVSSEGVLYLLPKTVSMAANVVWTVDGKVLTVPSELTAYDFDKDGDTDADDAQLLLDDVTAGAGKLKADVDGDGDTDTHDVSELLKLISAAKVVLPADGSISVHVTFSLIDEEKEFLDAYYTNGAYVEAFLYANPVSAEDGVERVSHSIPVLGFYGNWSDASMFDKGTLSEYWYEKETRNPYLPDSDGSPNMFGNMVTVKYANEDGEYYYFGNPLAEDDEYVPARNALNNENGDQIFKLYFASIRNAGDAKYVISDAETGEVYVEEDLGPVSAAFYYANGGSWQDTQKAVNLGWSGTKANGEKLPEGTTVNISLVLAPEYYRKADGTYDWDALGRGASLSTMTTIDNTAPEIEDVSVSLVDGSLDVAAKDNEYVSVVALYDAAGSKALTYVAPNQETAGETQHVRLDVSKVVGKTFLLQVYDYAMNVSTYKVSYDFLPDIDGYYTFFDLNKKQWYTYTEDASESAAMGATNLKLYAAEYADGYVFAIDEKNALYVMPDNDFANVTKIADLGAASGPLSYDFFVSDMAYNAAEKEMYFLAYSEANELGASYLFKLDLLTGATSLVGEMGKDIWTLASDGSNGFYGQGTFDNKLYHFTAATFAEPEDLGALDDELSIYMAQSSLAWDAKNQKLVFTLATASNFTGQILNSAIYTIDPTTRESKKLADHSSLSVILGCYVKAGRTDDASHFAPSTEAMAVSLSESTLSLLVNEKATLTAQANPWTLSDRSVTWSSSDDSVVTVKNGVVTGVGEGSAVITAASAVDPEVKAECYVTVTTLHITVEGALQDKDGHAQFYQWNLENKSWTPGKLIKDGEISIESTTLASSDLMYLMDATADSWAMHKINTATGEDLGSANGAGVPLWDMAYSSLFSTEEQDQIVGVYYYYLFSPKDPMNLDAYGFKLQSFLQQVGASYFTAITSAGETTVKLKSGETVPAEMFLALDNKGNMWVLNLYYTEADGYSLSGGCYETTLPELAFGGHEDSMYCSLVMADEGTTDGLTLFLSYFTGDTNELYMLNLMQSSDGLYFDATDVGNVGDSVWPATVNRVYGNASIKGIQTAEAAAEKNDIELTAQTVSAEKIERSTQEASGSLNTVSNAAAPAAQRVAAVKGGSMTANGDVDLTLTADETTTNGLLEITWDPSLMDYVSGVSTAQLSSFQPAEGKLLFGYAAEKEIASDAVLANLKFRPKDDVHCDLEVQVKTLQRNVESGLDLSETIVVKNENVEHNWGEWIVTKQPTCFAPGEETRVCADCGAEQTREIPASTENCPSKAFSDLDNTQWYHEGVDYVLNNELMLGVGGSLFEPDGTVTRAQLAMVLYRVAGKPDVKNTANPFKDVTEGVWYADAVKWAAEAGVVKGISADEFAPEVPVTRQEIATMLYRFAKAEAVAEDKLAAFPDAASVADWAKDAMNWAVATGLINGVKAADGTVTLDAQSGATRAQIATLLMRFLKG